MTKKVIIVGMASPYPEPKFEAEIWGVNYTYKHQPDVDRLFFLDDISYFSKNFVAEVNELNIPVMCQYSYESLKNSFTYPIDEILALFNKTYFTSTLSYMIAYAIYSGVEELLLWDISQEGNNAEYINQKACIEFWVGVAIGRGMHIEVSEKSNILKPMNGDTALYGYESQGMTMSKAMASLGLEPVL